MTQTPEDPQNLPETPSTVDLPINESFSTISETSTFEPVATPAAPAEMQVANTAAIPAVAAPAPAPTFVYAPPVTFTEQPAGSASPAVKKAIIAGIISGLLAGMLGFMSASMIGNTPAPSISGLLYTSDAADDPQRV
jgi:hypothetical protein